MTEFISLPSPPTSLELDHALKAQESLIQESADMLAELVEALAGVQLRGDADEAKHVLFQARRLVEQRRRNDDRLLRLIAGQ